MRLPRKKKKELKKAFDSLSVIDAIHAKAHILLSISRIHLKNLKSYPIKFGYDTHKTTIISNTEIIEEFEFETEISEDGIYFGRSSESYYKKYGLPFK